MKRISLLLVSLGVIAASDPTQAVWTSARGDANNRGFTNVDTAEAVPANGIAIVQVGIVAPGANPVAAPDGTLYIGNISGELIAMRPDGAILWRRQINAEHGAITASPVVGADGSIYVISTRQVGVPGGALRGFTFMHKFTPGGGWLFHRPFPTRNPNLPDLTDTGITNAPPNIWRHNGTEVIMVPLRVKIVGGFAIHLLAFDVNGNVLADRRINHRVYDVTGSSPITDAIGDFFSAIGDFLGCSFNVSECFSLALGQAPYEASPIPMPGVAIEHYPQGSPWIWVADDIKNTFAFKFDPRGGFTEIYRFSDRKDRRSTAPLALSNARAVVGTAEGNLRIERGGTGAIVHAHFGSIAAPVTMTSAGQLAIVHGRYGRVALFSADGTTQLGSVQLGFSNRAAAASCTHVYVSTTSELATLDPRTLQTVSAKKWVNDALYPPMIGPLGHVYALTSAGLHIHGPPTTPRTGPGTFGGQTLCSRPGIERVPMQPTRPSRPTR